MRVCVVGGGLAGSLLAWRLARATDDWQLDLAVGGHRADATAASGGAVRAYETHPEQRLLATVSMVELLASRVLRRWTDFRPVESVYLRSGMDGLTAAAAEIELLLPGSVHVAVASDLARYGWAELGPGGGAVLERRAGYTSPDRWRAAVLADGAVRRRVAILEGAVEAITPRANGAVECAIAGQRREYDIVVIAAGAWTPALLRDSGLAADGYRTKSIQFAVHAVDGWRPPQFVDEITGLYGRPTADGGVLLGLPTDSWDVDPDRPASVVGLPDAAAELARRRFPKLRIGPATSRTCATDCYADRPVLALRPAGDVGQRLFTFTGGSGACAKTVLAASHRAAVQLATLP